MLVIISLLFQGIIIKKNYNKEIGTNEKNSTTDNNHNKRKESFDNEETMCKSNHGNSFNME